MKKIICIILCLVITMAVGFTASAEEEIDVVSINRFGDLDGNGDVTAADARICLRASANLEELSEKQSDSADINGDGDINGTDARAILRAAAKVEILNASIGFFGKINSKVIIDGLKTAGSGRYIWYCTVEDENAVKVEETAWLVPEDGYDGAPVWQCFEITIVETGRYYVKFELKNSQNEVIDEFSFEIWCYYGGLLIPDDYLLSET